MCMCYNGTAAKRIHLLAYKPGWGAQLRGVVSSARSSHYNGVGFRKADLKNRRRNGEWYAYLHKDGKRCHVKAPRGGFANEEAAARGYDAAAMVYGMTTGFNFPADIDPSVSLLFLAPLEIIILSIMHMLVN